MVKQFLLSFFLVLNVMGQQFPTSVSSVNTLLTENNFFQSSLVVNITNSSLVIPIAANTYTLTFPTLLTIQTEIIKVCSGTNTSLTVCTNGRGFDGTSATSHPSGTTIRATDAAYYHNSIVSEIIAIESLLGGYSPGNPLYFLSLLSGAASRSANSKMGDIVSVLDFPGADPTGATDSKNAVLAAISGSPVGGCSIYFPPGTYRISSLGTLTKNCTLDFGGSTILPDTTGVWLGIPYFSGGGFVTLRNGTFTQYASVIPQDIIQIGIVGQGQGQPDTFLENINWYGAKAHHALVWNRSDYGTRISGGYWSFNTVDSSGALIYYSYAAAGDFSTFTIKASISGIDMSNNTARCIAIEGGDLAISDSVIESCSLGGIEHVTDAWYIGAMKLSGVYMEANQVFNLKFPKSTGNINATIVSNVTIESSSFAANPNNKILLLGQATHLNFIGNTSGNGCIGSSFGSSAGSLFVSGNSIYGASSGCSSNHYYLLDTATDAFAPLTGFITNAGVGSYPVSQTINPPYFQSLTATAGSHVVDFKNPSGAITSYPTIEGDYFARDLQASRDVVTNRYLSLKDGNSHAWSCLAEYRTSQSNLDCFFDGTLRFSFDNLGRLALGNAASGPPLTSFLRTGLLPVCVNNAACLAVGYVVGDWYRTGGDPDLVAQVH